MKTLGIIPARFGSTRFPGKPLAQIHGKSMIERVYRRAKMARLLSDVIVATDDQRIFDHVSSFGGKVVMTSDQHPSGTDRCAEVLAKFPDNYELVVNIQGDEPYIHPDQIDLLVTCFKGPDVSLATLVKKITEYIDLENVNIPKVVRQSSGKALYFSRRTIPFCKDADKLSWLEKGFFFKHIGIYGYRAEVLPILAKLPPTNLELCESLEQLRWLENGFQIMTAVTDHDNVAVDTPADIAIIENRYVVND